MVYHLSEDERKYTFDKIEKNRIFPKELIVCQWYDNEDQELEYKLSVNLLTKVSRWMRVRKKRDSFVHAEKTIEYLEPLDMNHLLGMQFLCKRRSVDNNIFIDRFIYNNGKCINLLENEGDEKELKNAELSNGIIGLREVTEETDYHSKQMAIPFSIYHLQELSLLLNLLSINQSI